MTQEQIGKRVGLSREAVANYMRLMKLPGVVMKFLMDGALTFTDAKSLLRLEKDSELMVKAAEKAVKENMSSAQLNDAVDEILIDKFTPEHVGKPAGGARWRWPCRR